MNTPIIWRIVCAIKAFTIFGFAAFVYSSTLSHLGQSRAALPEFMQSQAFLLAGYISLTILAFMLVIFVIRLAVGFFKAWSVASPSLQLVFLLAMLLWLVAISVMPLTEFFSPFSRYGSPNVIRYLVASLLLFGIPPIVTFIVWLAMEDRASITLLHRAIGSMVAGLLPGICGVGGMFLDTYNPASFAYGTLVGIGAIPVLLGFTFLCETKHEPSASPTP